MDNKSELSSKKIENSQNENWREAVRFRFEDWGWVVINIGMGIGAGIAFLPVEAGMKGLQIFLAAAFIGYPAMYLFQRLFINTLSEADSCKDYSGVISGYLGKNWGVFIGTLYFLMMIIWFFVYSETVTNDSGTYLKSFGVTGTNWGNNPLYVTALITFLVFVASKGERLLFKLSSVLAITVLTIVLLLGLSMIPEWNFNNIPETPRPLIFTRNTIITLPFVLTSILFLQSLSPMVVFFRKNSVSMEAARYRGLRAMNIAFFTLFTIVFFYALSFNFSMTQEQAFEAYRHNISALAAASKEHHSGFSKILEVLLDIFAVLACFMSVFLGLRDASKGLAMNILKRFQPEDKINEKYLGWGIICVLIMLGVLICLINPPILTFTLICSPIFGLVGCLIPAWLVLKVPKLHKFRNFSLIIIIIVGILLCISPFLAMT